MRGVWNWIVTRTADYGLPKQIELIDIVQILLIAFFVYHLIRWLQNTKAYTLMKGIFLIGVFVIIANVLKMQTILWLFGNIGGAAITAVVIIFQPELRRVVEQIGEKNPLSAISFASGQEENERFSDKTINELVRASFEMGEVKTGALIVIEKTITLEEYEKTGIPIDGVLTSQLLINIFEHNTPLHDGAVIVRNNRVTAATCYLPLSDNMDLNKNLGTRHRAGVGISEVTDSFTIIVSEETGNVSYASGGELHTAVTPSDTSGPASQNPEAREKTGREERMAYPRNASESGGREEMKKKILKKLLNNLPLKILSILIAIVIWYVVVSVNDPIVKERFDVPVQVTNEAYIAAGKKTYQIEEEYQTVTVTVTDNNSVVSRLKASDITVTADLTQIVTMDTNPVYVPIKATCSMVKQEKLSTVTATIPVEIEDVDSEKFPITIDAGNTKPAKDYEVGTMTSDPESITISGPTSLINKISSVVAKVDVTNMRNSGTVTADLMIIDKNQDEMPESQMEFLNFDSGSPQVDVDIELWRRVSGIKLSALYSGTPADGYQIKNIYTTPEEITVAGSEEALAKLADEGNTIEIPEDYTSVAGQRSDVETTVDLSDVLADVIDLKVSSSSSASVTVHVTVMPNESREFELDVDQIETSNLQSTYTVLYDQTQLAIRIKASDKNLAKLDTSQINASIDLNGMGVGDYEVPVKITLPDGYELVDSVKTTIHIKEKAVANKTTGTN